VPCEFDLHVTVSAGGSTSGQILQLVELAQPQLRILCIMTSAKNRVSYLSVENPKAPFVDS
jgi:hypothetical protein